MGFERNYQLKNPSNQFKFSSFSTFNSPSKSLCWFWTGFIDAEGSFSIVISKNNKRKLGWRITPKFQIGLHKKDLILLKSLQHFLNGIGTVRIIKKREVVSYSIDSLKDLIKLINHLDKYPLLTQKKADFILFKQVIMLISDKEHLTIEGLYKIINIKASINLGLSEMLKTEFNKFIPVLRPDIKNEEILDSNWISGFVAGDGNFDVGITKTTYSIGYRVQLKFRITQHIRDIKLMESIIKYLGSGYLYKYPRKEAVSVVIFNNSDIIKLIIPFFEENPLLGIKLLDFQDWCQIAKLIDNGSHLTLEGFNLIRKIKSGMNKSRKIESD